MPPRRESSSNGIDHSESILCENAIINNIPSSALEVRKNIEKK